MALIVRHDGAEGHVVQWIPPEETFSAFRATIRHIEYEFELA